MPRRHRFRHLLAGSTAVVLTLFVPADVAYAAPGAAAQAPGQTAAAASCAPVVAFRSQNFDHPTRIDNRFLPMVPGTQLILEGRANRGTGSLPHQVVFTVTNLTKVVNGVTTRVIYDVDRNEGQIAEAELAFFAQDDPGNVWNLGEYPEEYEAGTFTGAPNVWIAGLERAQAGIHMLAEPARPANRNREYLQGRAPAIDFLDCAKVVAVGGKVNVPAGRFSDVLTTNERSPLEATAAVQIKDHAPGVGIVRVGARNDPEAETLVLVKAAHLGPRALIEADIQAARLDIHGHQVSDVYRQTPPVRLG
jgi:hypothetical protein